MTDVVTVEDISITDDNIPNTVDDISITVGDIPNTVDDVPITVDDINTTVDDADNIIPCSNPTTDNVPISQPINLGPDGLGGYYTPYNMTFIYNPASMFETAVSALSYRPQLIPHTVGAVNVSADCIGFLTPELFIFGTDYSHEELTAFHSHGYVTIHVFPYQATDKYNSLMSSHSEQTEQTEQTSPPITSNFVHIVKLDDLMDHIKIEHMTGVQALEYVMCHTFNLPSEFIQDSLRDGHYFVHAVCAQLSALGEPIPFEQTFAKVNTMRGFQEIEDLVSYGKFLDNNAEKLANKSLSVTPVLKLDITCAVPAANIDDNNENVKLFATFAHLPSNRPALENEACVELARIAPRTATVNYLLRTEFVVGGYTDDGMLSTTSTPNITPSRIMKPHLNVILSTNYNAPIGANELLKSWNATEIIGGHNVARGITTNFDLFTGCE